MNRPSVHKLDNGMDVVIQSSHASPVVAVNVWINVGSGLELDSEAGICHVIEHMLFKGTKKRGVGQIASEIESAGGDINAYTTLDSTVYYIVLASRFFETGLEVLADAVINSSFDALETEREKEVVLEEIKRSNDIPNRKLSQEVFASSFSNHPYRRPVIGFEETVKNFSRKNLLDFYHRWYVGENITLVVVGDVVQNEALDKINRAFKGLPPGRPPRRRNNSPPSQRRLRAFTMREDVSETYLELAFQTPGIKSDDLFPLDVLAVALGQGESSILFRGIKATEGLVSNIYSYSFTPLEHGLFLISSALELKNSDKAMRRIMEECYNIGRNGLCKEDMARAKANLESDFIYQKETVQGQARELGFFHSMLGNVDFENEYLRGIEQVKDADIRRVAQSYLVPSRLTAGMLHPQDEKKTGLKNRIIDGVRSASLPTPKKTSPRVIAVPSKDNSGTTKVSLKNGATLIVREMRNCPVVALRAVFRGGVRYENERNNGINNFIAEMLTKGTKKRTAIKIAQETEAIAGHLDGFAGRNSLGVYGEFLSKNFHQGLDLFSDVLLHPSFRKGEMGKKKSDVFSSLRQQQDNPAQMAFVEFARTLYRKHPYRLNIQGSMDSVAALNSEMLEKYYRMMATSGNLVLAVTGDVDAEEVVEMVGERFAEMKPGKARLPAVVAEPAIRNSRRSEINREKEQAHIVLGFLGTRVVSKDRYPLIVLNSVLSGQGGRLFLELRDRMSLAYSVTSFSQEGIDRGYFGVYIGTSPNKVDVALEAIIKELDKVANRKVGKAELERAKKFVTGTYEIDLQRCGAQAARLAFYESYGLGYQEMFRYPDKIMKVTAQDVLEVAQRYLDMKRHALIIARPAPAPVEE